MKKRYFKTAVLLTFVAFILGFNGVSKEAFANQLLSGWEAFNVMPFRYIAVKGDAAKFRALNWMNDGATGGIKDMLFSSKIGKDGELSFEGHAIPGDNDFGTMLKLTNGNGGYMTMDYGNFRKWYDVYGGYFSDFTGTSISKLTIDPALDIGHFDFEVGSNPEDAAAISLNYERETKVGTKSRLAWGSVTEGGRTRKINPSWQSLDEVNDSITLKGNVGVAGFNVEGKQIAEFLNSRSLREDNASTTLVRESSEPQAKRLVSSLKAGRWTIDEKTYMAFAYQFQHLTSDIVTNILAFDSTTGAPASDSHNGLVNGQSSRDSHTLVQHFVSNLTPDLNFIVKLKEEVAAQFGSGQREAGLGGSRVDAESENQSTTTGQSFSLRYSGLPKTSLYTDWDFKQWRNWQSKYRYTTSAGYTEYLDSGPETTGVMGIRYAPNGKFNLTSNLRLKSDHNTYNIFTDNDGGINISRLQTEANEWNSRFTWKPAKWFENSFRLQLADTSYHIQTVQLTQNDWIKSNANARVFTYDVTLMPLDEWMFNFGASLNQFKVSTPASQVAVSGGGIPVFETDVYTLLFSTSYAPKENLSVYSSAQYSRADNFDAKSFLGIPYGVNNERYDINLGVKWSPKSDLTVEPHYGYYAYRSNPDDNYSMDYGNYSAHALWLDASVKW